MKPILHVVPFLLLLFGLAAPAAAQEPVIPDVAYPTLPARAARAEGFVPAGWRIERRAEGDLDGDGAVDLALVLRMQDPANVLDIEGLGEDPFDTNPRILAIAFAQPGSGYRLAVRNHVLIPRREMPTQSDPFFAEDTEFEVVRGTLRVSLYRFMNAGGWDAGPTRFNFRWQDGALRLIGYDHNNIKRNTGCLTTLSMNFLTRRARLSATYIDTDSEEVRWRRLGARPLATIDEVGDGLAFDPDGLVSGFPMDCPWRE